MSSIFDLFLDFIKGFISVIKGFISRLSGKSGYEKEEPSGNSGYEKEEPKMSPEEAKILITLTAKVAKSDGVVNETEAIMIGEILDDLVRKMGGDEYERNLLKRVYEINKDKEHDIYSLAFHYNQKFHLSSSRKSNLIKFFLIVAYKDHSFTEERDTKELDKIAKEVRDIFANYFIKVRYIIAKEERDIIAEIARGFGMSSGELSSIFRWFEDKALDYLHYYYNGCYRVYSGYEDSYSGYEDSYSGYEYGEQNYGDSSHTQNTKKDPYEVLGVDNGASLGEIKKKYRELVKKYHPDILMGNGADDEIIQKGTKKLQEINEAYESLNERLSES